MDDQGKTALLGELRIEAIASRLRIARELFQLIDAGKIKAAVEMMLSTAGAAVVLQLRESLGTEGGVTKSQAFDLIEKAIDPIDKARGFQREWLGNSTKMQAVIAGMIEKCDIALENLPDSTGFPEAEAVYEALARWLVICGEELASLSRAAADLTERVDGASLARFVSVIGGRAQRGADAFGLNWGEEVVPRWMNWLFHDVVLDDPSEVSVRSLLAMLGVQEGPGEISPEEIHAFHHILTRRPRRGDQPNWKVQAAEDGGEYLNRVLPLAIKQEAKRLRGQDRGDRDLDPSGRDP